MVLKPLRLGGALNWSLRVFDSLSIMPRRKRNLGRKFSLVLDLRHYIKVLVRWSKSLFLNERVRLRFRRLGA